VRPGSKKKIGIGVGILFLLLVSIVIFFDWNWLRGPVAKYIGAKLERDFAINGDLHVKLANPIEITANDVVLGNASWSADPIMAQARQISIHLSPRPLLSKQIVVPEVALSQPQLLLERNTEGKANWDFASSKSDGSAPTISTLRIDDGKLRYRDPIVETDVTLALKSEKSATGELGPAIRFTGKGELQKRAFQIEGLSMSSLLNRKDSDPFRLQVEASAGNIRASFSGSFILVGFNDIDGQLTLEGADLAELFPIIPVPLPWTPPYHLAGHLQRHNDEWTFREFTGKVGSSDLAGNFVVHIKQPRPAVVADLQSQRLNYKDLGGLVGIPPGEKPAANNSTPQKKEAAKRAVSDKVLPDIPYNLEKLSLVDADVRFRAQRFQESNLPLDNLDTHLDLQAGLLKLEPLNFGVGGGQVAANLVLDGRQPLIRTTADVTVRNVELKEVFPALKPPNGSAGKITGRARLTSSGNSIAKMLGSLNGEIALLTTGGQASTLTLVLTDLDLARAAALLLRGDDNSTIRCVVADLVAKDGTLNAQSFVADTSAVNITGDGNISLRDEQYDLHLKTKSKRPSPLALRGPIAILGTFKQPKVTPEIGPLAARLGASIALGALAWPLALLPLIDPGRGKDSACGELIAEAQQRVAKTPLHPKAPSKP
jgi:uncharacterized protein involved in outer membrane biogenesis